MTMKPLEATETGQKVSLLPLHGLRWEIRTLLAWELAEQDGVTAELLGKTGLDEVPELGSDGWSDEE